MSKITKRHPDALRAAAANQIREICECCDELVRLFRETENDVDPGVKPQDIAFYEAAAARWIKRLTWYDESAIKEAKRAQLEAELAALDAE